MSVNADFNIGTVVTITLFITAQTLAGVWWAATISANVNAMRAWQIRQDDRLVKLEAQQQAANEAMAASRAILDILREETQKNTSTILNELKATRGAQGNRRMENMD